MSLEVSFVVLELDDCQTFRVYDNTGAYAASTNAGGFGAPNPVVGDATAATLAISLRNSDGTFTAYNTIDLFNTLPNIIETPFDITAEDAGFGTDSSFPAGVYEMTYTVSGSGFSSEYTQYVVLKCAIENCYSEKAVELSQCDCNCDGLETSLINMNFYLDQLDKATQSGNLTWMYNVIQKLNTLCSECGCGCE